MCCPSTRLRNFHALPSLQTIGLNIPQGLLTRYIPVSVKMSPVWSVVLVALSFSQLVYGHCQECKVDVCFVLAETGCASEWNNARRMISTLVYLMDIGPDATQIGLVQFADEAQVEFDLDDYDNRANVLSAIHGLSQDGGCPKLSAGLDTVRTDCFGTAHGERPGVPRLVIMVTDGKSKISSDDPGTSAAAVRNDNITILVVGVNDPDVPTINIIANNVAENTFLPGPIIVEPILLPTGVYTFGSVVTALFNRFKDFCTPESDSTLGGDCNDVIGESGRLQINIASPDQTPEYQEVLCENGWMVLLMRQDGSVNFTRPWADYRDGFGQLDGEIWAGLELMNRVTNNGHDYKLRVDFEIYNIGTQYYAEYSSFIVGPASDKYRLNVTGYDPLSTLGDSLSYHTGMRFSTIDEDHDTNTGASCAQSNGGGGWWWNSCAGTVLTGLYGRKSDVPLAKGIWWANPLGYSNHARVASMKIKRV